MCVFGDKYSKGIKVFISFPRGLIYLLLYLYLSLKEVWVCEHTHTSVFEQVTFVSCLKLLFHCVMLLIFRH